MKRVMFICILLAPIILWGCSQNEGRFDHAALKEEFKKEGLFPKLPTKFPINIEKYERVIPPHETNINEVIFKGEDEGMQFSLTIQPTPVEYINFEGEKVTVNGNSGFFTRGPGSSIHWTDEDYHYILTSYSDKNGTKERMVETAESFK
jgi:hypothetical protein